MSNRQVAENFANGKNTGHSMNMFIDGNTVFSYGYHFPIARITDTKDENGKTIALFTNRGYSNTTAKHKNLVSVALCQAGFRVITCDISSGKIDNSCIERLSNEVKELRAKQVRARKEWSKSRYSAEAGIISADIDTLRLAYSL